MSLEILILFGIIAGMLILFAFEILPHDLIAIICMVSLIIFGLVTPEEGIAGLSNSATVTVLALMILSIGLEQSGVIALIGQKMEFLFRQKEWTLLLGLMVLVGLFSAFIATTAVVIVFMRMMFKMSERLPMALSRLLMPLSFAGILGGSCTLLGTSTNILVNAIGQDYGIEPFGVFEFSHVGIIFFLVGLVYMLVLGRRILPKGKSSTDQLTEAYNIQDFLIELVILPGSPLIGKRLSETVFFANEDLDLFEVKRPGGKPHLPAEQEELEEGELLFVKGSASQITELMSSYGLALPNKRAKLDDTRFNTDQMRLLEVIVHPNSRFLGKQLDKLKLKRELGAIPLAVKKANRKYIRRRPGKVKVEAGDVILMEVARRNFDRIYNMTDLVVLQDHGDRRTNLRKVALAVSILVFVVTSAALNVFPLLVSALLGCVMMVVSGCLNLKKAYKSVDWSVIILLAGVIPLGTAMDNTGASELIAEQLAVVMQNFEAQGIVAFLFLITAILSAVISNNATAILMAPLAVSVSASLGVDPRALLLTVMFAANTSYISPIGYQTNTLVYTAGEYRFKDFFRVGGILSILIWGVASLAIPYFFF